LPSETLIFRSMRKKEYKFNSETLSYEPVRRPARLRRFAFIRRCLLLFILASIIDLVYSFAYYTPKMHNLERDNRLIVRKYGMLEDRIASADKKIDEIHVRDNRVYRPLFGADTLDIPGIYTPFAQNHSIALDGTYGQMIQSVSDRLDAQMRLIYRQSKSLDQLQAMSKDKEKIAGSIPAIWPINKRNLKGSIGAFGRRLHPIYHRYIMHKGIDLGGHKGDPIYATGNGVVQMVDDGRRYRGYGKQILISHGFGYQTRYAHLSEVLVKSGQAVRRGELIGFMGSTGGSTGDHLHYEVIYMKQNVDPVNYFRRDMSEAEFEQIIATAKTTIFETYDDINEQEKE